MKRFILPGLAAAAVTIGAVAYAKVEGGHAGGRHMMFEMLDANKDGTVTRAEATAAAEKHFAEVDTNKDGVITAPERDAIRARMVDAHFKRMDADNNGQISPAEFRAGHEKMGSADGHRSHGGMGKGSMMQGDMTKAAAVTRAQAMFDRIDADHDGKITAAERDAARSKMRGHGKQERPAG